MPAALLLLWHTLLRSIHLAPVTCLMGKRPALPCTLQAPLPDLLEETTQQALDSYYDDLYAHMRRVHTTAGQ